MKSIGIFIKLGSFFSSYNKGDGETKSVLWVKVSFFFGLLNKEPEGVTAQFYIILW